MVTNTGSHPKDLWPGVKIRFGTSYKEKPLVAAMVFKTVSSDKKYEEYVENIGLGLAAEKAEAAALTYDSTQQGYVARLTNTTYALGAKVSMEAIQDNQYEAVAQKKASQLARSMRLTKETVFANVLNRAFTSGYTGGDGVVLGSAAHPAFSGNQSNLLSIAADLSEAALEDMHTAIRGATDSRGLKIGLKGMKLVIAPANEFNATRILSSLNQSGTANNDINAMRAMGMLPGGVVVWDYLTDADAWFVITDSEEGLIMQNRMALALDQDNDFDTKNACMSAIERYAAGWSDWRGIWCSAGA